MTGWETSMLAVASAAIAAASSPAAAPSFSTTIAPVLKARCASCHMTGTEAGGVSLAPSKAYASLVDVSASQAGYKRVEPGAPDKSYLLMKIEGTHLDHGGRGARMPFGDEPLDPATVAMIRQWIAAGAPRN